jgi:hypothetical protein
MNREELMAQLRDIHVPPAPVETLALEFALWPIILYLVLAALVGAILLWQRSAWRREAKTALRHIEAEPDQQKRWSGLLDLSSRIGRVRGSLPATPTMPAAADQDPARIGERDLAQLQAYVRPIKART